MEKIHNNEYKDIDLLKEKIQKILLPIREINKNTKAEKDLLFEAKETQAGYRLPEYYLCYFVFVEILGYRNLGRFEKVAWSVPIDYNGQAFLLEHRKFGLGLFAHDPNASAKAAEDIVKKIIGAVKAAQPYFEFKVEEAVKKSQLNVVNHSFILFERLKYFIKNYKTKCNEAEKQKKEKVVKKLKFGESISFSGHQLKQEAEWIALSAIDAFFSWTEHVFIHVAILKGEVTTGKEVAELARSEWAIKFKTAIDISSNKSKEYFDRLSAVKKQLKNYMAHGAFGKKGEAFYFHSSAGAVPVVLNNYKDKGSYSISSNLEFDEEATILLIEKFIEEIWIGKLETARIYIESSLPLILTMAKNGEYSAAMTSKDKMVKFVDELSHQFTDAGNMDW